MGPSRREVGEAPMKRDRRLYPLSWGHHDLLVYADRMKMALTTDHPSYRHSVEELIEKSKNFWNSIFFEHMNAEREVLFPVLIQFPEDYQQKVNIVIGEFNKLSDLYSEIITCSKGEQMLNDKLIRFSELIVHHVRFEERELFPKIEDHLPSAEFDRIGAGLEQKLPRICRTPLK